MTADEVDVYLAGLEEPKWSTLEALRRSIRAVVPGAEECTTYGMPAFRVGGKVVAGFAAFKSHLAYLPHSGKVLADLGDALTGYENPPRRGGRLASMPVRQRGWRLFRSSGQRSRPTPSRRRLTAAGG